MENQPWLKDVLVFFAAAGLIVPLFHRARIGAVLGFLLIGLAVGPLRARTVRGRLPVDRLLTIDDRERAATFAEFGVMFLLFLIGLEMSIERLWSLRHYVLGIGGIHFVLSALAIGVVVTFYGAPGIRRSCWGLPSPCPRPPSSCNSSTSRAVRRRRSAGSLFPCCCFRT